MTDEVKTLNVEPTTIYSFKDGKVVEYLEGSQDIIYPASYITAIPTNRRIIIKMVFDKFPSRLLLGKIIPEELGLAPNYYVASTCNPEIPLGSRILLDTHSGGSETKVHIDTNHYGFVQWRTRINEMKDADRSKFFNDFLNVQVVEYFVMLDGQVSSILL